MIFKEIVTCILPPFLSFDFLSTFLMSYKFKMFSPYYFIGGLILSLLQKRLKFLVRHELEKSCLNTKNAIVRDERRNG